MTNYCDGAAVVTGASKGIGLETVHYLLREGRTVIGISRSAPHLRFGSRHQTKNFSWVSADLASDHGRAEALDSLHRLPVKIGGLVHCLGGSFAAPEVPSHEDFRRLWEMNLGVSIQLNDALFEAGKFSQESSIVHVSTLSVKTRAGSPAYVAAKAAVEAYVQSMSKEYFRRGIRINAVAPGAIRVAGRFLDTLADEAPRLTDWLSVNTPRTHRLGIPSEVASAIGFLLRDDSSFISGHVLSVDGGA